MAVKLSYGSALVICVITSMLMFAFLYYISGKSPRYYKSIAVDVTAPELIATAGNDEALFSHRYNGRVLSVSGVVRDIRGRTGGPYTVLLGGKPGLAALWVSCTLDSMYNNRRIPLAKDDSCTILGTCAGQFTDIVLVHCLINK